MSSSILFSFESIESLEPDKKVRFFSAGKDMLCKYEKLHSYLREQFAENSQTEESFHLKLVESPDEIMEKFARSRETELITMALLQENGIPSEFHSKYQNLPTETRDWLWALNIDKRAFEVQKKLLEYMEERVASSHASEVVQNAFFANESEVPTEYLKNITVSPNDIRKVFGHDPALLVDAKHILSKLEFKPFEWLKPIIGFTIFSPIFLKGRDYLVCPKLLLVSMLFRVAFMIRDVMAHTSDTA